MSGIFISYRRDDTSYIAGRLHDQLAARFGTDRIFRDIDAIRPGADFVERINEAVGSCRAVVVLIGDGWLTSRDATGQRRLDNPADFVRVEVAAALDRDDVLVVPVLVEDTTMPSEADLPPALKALSRRNAVDLTDARWDYDVARLAAALEQVVAPAPTPTPVPEPPGPARRGGSRRALAIGGGALAAVVVALVAALLVVGGDGGDDDPTPPTTSVAAPSTAPRAPALEAIGLSSSDVAIGWTANPPVTAHLDTAVSRCVGGPDQRTWPRAASPNFVSADGSMGASSATVRAPNPGAADTLHRAFVDRYVSCARANPENFAFAPGARLRSFDARDVPAPAGVRLAAFRAVIDVPAGGSTIQTNIDIVHMVRGDVEVEMELIGNGRPFPAADATRLIEAVARRM